MQQKRKPGRTDTGVSESHLIKEGIQAGSTTTKQRHKLGNTWAYGQETGRRKRSSDHVGTSVVGSAADKASERAASFAMKSRQDAVPDPCEDDGTYAGEGPSCPTSTKMVTTTKSGRKDRA